jgi:Domain of unknown function (DUF4340)
MSRDKLIIVGAVVLGVLGLLVVQQAKKDAAMGQPLATATDFPVIGAPDDIDKISLKNGEKAEIVLVKVADSTAPPADGGAAMTWEMSEPLKASVNQQAVKDLVGNLKEVKVDSAVNLRLDDDVKKDKQLDPAHAVHVMAWKGIDKKVDDFFGKSGTAGQLVMVANKPERVWAAKGYSGYLYTKEPKDFRDKEVLKFDDASASGVTITNSHGVLSFTKGDKWAGTFDKKPIPRFDEEKVKDLLRAYKALSAEDFGDGKSLAETGLDKPDARVTIELKDGAGTYDLIIGKGASASNRWTKRSSSETIYQIGSYAADFALSDVTKYQSAADAGAVDAAKPAGKH